jgi:MurNAc alpha-1-phosphate uridylyltransferase
MRALILAAGEGRRMRPLTRIIPKPLVEAGGMPLALRQMLSLRKAGVSEFVVNTAYGAAVIEKTLGDGSRWGVSIRYSHEGESAEEALETLGGIVRALPLLTAGGEDAFIVAAGDIVTAFDFSRLVRRGGGLGAAGLMAHLVLVPNPAYHAGGDMSLDESGLVRREPRTHTFASFGVYRAALFEGLEPVRAKLFPWLWSACEKGLVSGEVFEGLWRNVGDWQELAAADAALRAAR